MIFLHSKTVQIELPKVQFNPIFIRLFFVTLVREKPKFVEIKGAFANNSNTFFLTKIKGDFFTVVISKVRFSLISSKD